MYTTLPKRFVNNIVNNTGYNNVNNNVQRMVHNIENNIGYNTVNNNVQRMVHNIVNDIVNNTSKTPEGRNATEGHIQDTE